MEKVTSKKYFLVDNGSLQPESIIYMRNVAVKLIELTGFRVTPSGIMHSHKVDATKLNGKPGLSMESFFHSKNSGSFKNLAFIPMFIGPSRAITDWLPEKLEVWSHDKIDRKYSIADCLFRKGDHRLATAISEYVADLIPEFSPVNPYVILVDHGTPLQSVNLVREEIGSELAFKLDGRIAGFSTACMERRAGDEYNFNDPLLENLLKDIHSRGKKSVIIAQLFLTPGRHAGPRGDIAQICEPFIKDGMKIQRTPTLGDHPLVLEILVERLKEVSR